MTQASWTNYSIKSMGTRAIQQNERYYRPASLCPYKSENEHVSIAQVVYCEILGKSLIRFGCVYPAIARTRILNHDSTLGNMHYLRMSL